VDLRFPATAFASWFLLFGLTIKAAGATAASTSFGVSAVVQASCQASPTRAKFRNYTAALASAASSVSVSCTNSTPYSISLSTDFLIAPGMRIFELPLSNPAGGLGIQGAALKQGFKSRSRANANLGLEEANRPYAIDDVREFPHTITVIITY
jgi:hypothetical protein